MQINNFHLNGCAPGLALIERLEAARKWTINLQIEVFQSIGALDLLTLSRYMDIWDTVV